MRYELYEPEKKKTLSASMVRADDKLEYRVTIPGLKLGFTSEYPDEKHPGIDIPNSRGWGVCASFT